MTTTKRRLNISLPPDIEATIRHLAWRDGTPQATEVTRLLAMALEIEEDEMWNARAEMRDKRGAKFISHRKAWA